MKRFILFLNLFLVFAGTLTAQTVTTIDALKTALVSGTESTITLGADGLELNSVITTSRTVTLDLNNHTLSTDCQEGALTVTGGGNLTIKNGTLAGERGDFLTAKGGTINLESTLIVTGYSSIVWAYNGGVVNINGAKLHTTNTSVAGCTSGEYAAVSATNNGTIVVNEGSEVKADRKSALRCLTGGTITVNGGNIISEANGDSGDGAVLCSGGTYVINNGTFTTPNTETVKINSGSITVNGGTFTTCEICNVVFMKTNGTVTLKGGTYNRNVTPYVAQGYTCIQTGDVKWTVTQGLVQRTSGTTVTYYPTLKLAADASIADDEIKLLADFTSTEVATFAFPVTLDLNGKTLTVNVTEGLTSTGHGDVTIDNGIITATTAADIVNANGGKITLGEDLVINSNNAVIYSHNGGEVAVEGASITVTNSPNTAAFAENANTTITINSGTVSQNGTDHVTVSAKDYAKVIVNGGQLLNSHSSTVAVRENAEAVINEGVVETTVQNPAFCAAYSYNNGKIVVNGGELKAATGSPLVAAGLGKLEIKGGTITSNTNYYAVLVHENDGSYAHITGGNITNTSTGYALYCKQGSVLIENGGTNADNATSPVIGALNPNGTVGHDSELNGEIIIKGGTFSKDLKTATNYVDDAYCTVKNYYDNTILNQNPLNQTNTWTVLPIEDMYVARITPATESNGEAVTRYYLNLTDANAEAEAGDTLRLLKNQESGKDQSGDDKQIVFRAPVVLDLNDSTLTVDINEGLMANANTGDTVKIINGTITSTKDDIISANGGNIKLGANLVINEKSSVIYAYNGGVVTVDGAVLSTDQTVGNYVAAYATGIRSKIDIKSGEINATTNNALAVENNATANVSGGKVSSNNWTAYSASNGVINVTGGEITSANTCAIVAAGGGKLNIAAGEISTTSATVPSEDGTGYPVGAVTVWENHSGTADNPDVTISGGVIKSQSGYGVLSTYGAVVINSSDESTPIIIGGKKAVSNFGPTSNSDNGRNTPREGIILIKGGRFSDDVADTNNTEFGYTGIYAKNFLDEGLGTKVIIDEDHSRLENGYMWQVDALDTVLISGKTYNYFYIADTIRKPSTADDRGFTATLQSDGSDVLANVQLKEGHQVLAKGFDKGEYPMNLTADMFMAAEPTPNQPGAGPYAFKVVQDGKLIIKPRMLDYKFKENKGSKNYDGTVLVATYDDIEAVAHTEVGYGLAGNDHFTAGTLTTSDYIAGTYPCTIGQFQADGDLETLVEGFAIMNGDENKTGNYTPVFGKLALAINKHPITVTATDNKEYDELPFGPETGDGYTLTGSLADGDEITVEISEDDEVCPGTYANAITNVTVNKTDDNNRDVTSSYAITKVNGSLTIAPLACTGTFTYEGYDYPLVLINGQCWFAENLRVAKEGATAYKEDAANLEKFGYLYDWATALGDNGTKETDVCNGDFVQGICPQGWALPSNADFQALENYAHGVEAIKSDNANYWQLQYVGTDEYGFDERAGGFFKSALNRYEDLLTGAHFWTSESVLNPSIVTEGEAYSYCTAYYCTEFLPQIKSVNDKLSVRCIRKTPYENGEGGSTEPETFTCGTSKMKDADNNEYETVLIGNQCWTKTNLRVAPAGATNETVSGNYSETEAYYYVNPSVDASVYGYYYNWHAAMLACPAGWHLPTTEEWIIMEQSQTTMDVSGTEVGWYGDFAGKLVGGNDWDASTESNAPGDYSYVDRNASGFSAVPAGYWWEVSYQGVGTRTDFWTSSEVGNFHWVHFLSTNESGVSRYTDIGSVGNSVRCVKD